MCATLNQKDVPENFYRPQNGRTLNWYVRLVPPLALKGIPGVCEYRKSTGTADLRRAKTVGAQLIADKRAEWEQILSKHKTTVSLRVLSTELVKHICAQRLYHWMRIDDEARVDGDGYTYTQLSEFTRLCEVTEKSMRSILARGKSSSDWGDALDIIDFWCNQIDTPVHRSDPLYTRLVHQFAEVEVEGATRVIRRFNGEAVNTPVKPEAIGASLSAMTDLYREYKLQSSGGKHVGTSTHVWIKLIEHLGDISLSNVTGHDIYEFLGARMRAPIKPWSMGHAHGFVRRTLREVFALARTKGLLKTSNPIDDLELLPMLSLKEEASRKRPRLPFTDIQLSTIFTSAWYQIDAQNWKGKMARDLGARYWVPLVCLVHGNRVTEVLQLIASDFGLQEGMPTIHFQTDVEGGHEDMQAAGVSRSLKNGATQRIVPLHPLLIELGFVEFLEERRKDDGENALLFPSSLPVLGGKTPIIGRAYEQAFLRFVRDKLEFGRGYGNHSFRHQLEDRIRDAQKPGQVWPAGLALAYTGRSRVRDDDLVVIKKEGSAKGYGRGHKPAMMLEYITTLSFDGIKLPPAFKDWSKGV